ncbi:metallophosphoesterase [Polyangium sp. 6x1]|uniref:metallophosphoesterase family protein n=1 Tax=Polyangium sp. 6x1 TaxID=3042689 RepID=UPI002482AA63|nr:metallophosphoesterase [Polyangium sp. 6x1]MDI1450259.1 metallophosphoesterase [Polyangium sp. 6x1]
MKLLAISDLHVGFPDNHAAVASLGARPDDWLVLGGDLGETFEHVRFVLDTLAPRFRKLVWVPGNHELYVPPHAPPGEPRGAARYARYVELCRERGVLTPEDPYPVWEGEGGAHLIVPMFLLYDYTFRPDDVPVSDAVAWAAEHGIAAADEFLLDPAPFSSRQAWCHARVAETEARLRAAPGLPKVLINHFPLRQDLVFLPRVPRFSPWCGTRKTTDWHVQFDARVVVQGHLHVRRTVHVDGVRFEEVSYGYPRERRGDRPIDAYVKQILPTPEPSP